MHCLKSDWLLQGATQAAKAGKVRWQWGGGWEQLFAHNPFFPRTLFPLSSQYIPELPQWTEQKVSSRPGLLILGPPPSLLGWPSYWRVFSSIPDLNPLDASSTSQIVISEDVSSDIATCPPGRQNGLVENYCFGQMSRSFFIIYHRIKYSVLSMVGQCVIWGQIPFEPKCLIPLANRPTLAHGIVMRNSNI